MHPASLGCMNRNAAVLSSLAIGFAGAFAVSEWLPAATPGALVVADVIGNLWISAVRMTVIPLVVSLLVTSIAGSASGRDLPRLGTRASVIFLLLLSMAALCALPLATAAFNWLPDNAPMLTPDQTP